MDNNSFGKPCSPAEVKQLIRIIISQGNVIPTQHSKRAMKDDNLSIVDCINVLRGGCVEPAEWENGAWRYRVQTARICVVIELESETELILVTAWRKA